MLQLKQLISVLDGSATIIIQEFDLSTVTIIYKGSAEEINSELRFSNEKVSLLESEGSDVFIVTLL